VERDVRSVLNVKDLAAFYIFVKMCAARIGQLLNLSALPRDCGISHNTAKEWLSVLESSGIVYLLRPYYRNFSKRLVKSPKLYFVDTRLASRILGIKNAEQLFLHPARCGLFESFVISEMLKHWYNQGSKADIYFWRDNIGKEIDVVFEEGMKLRALEIKSGKTFSAEFSSNLEAWIRYSGSSPEDCALIYAGDREFEYKGIAIRRWNNPEIAR
jgi:hypothetical protein